MTKLQLMCCECDTVFTVRVDNEDDDEVTCPNCGSTDLDLPFHFS